MLITSLINCYIGDNATTDAISMKLREICPSIYSQEDAICSKVINHELFVIEMCLQINKSCPAEHREIQY